MVKKRRLLGNPSPGPSKAKKRVDGRKNSTGSGDDVTTARALLNQALHVIVHSDEESSSSQEDPHTKALSVKREQKPFVRRRKRKPGMDLELAFHHHTFVMKLFDRSVDLAQFKEETPLYPICRAWIANQPRLPLPLPAAASPEIKKEEDPNDYQMELDGLKEVHKLPSPSGSPWPHRVPPVEPPTLQGVSLDYSSEDLPTAEELLKGHLSKWGNVRKKWVEAAQTNEARYAKSLKILSNMYKRSQNLI